MKTLIASAGVLLAACSAAPPAVGEVEEPVINGFNVPATDRVALVRSTDCQGEYFKVCTGTMITNDWLLTAAHCLYECPSASNTIITMNGQTIPATRTVIYPTGVDLAMVKLSYPMIINNWAIGFQSSLYTYTGDSLVGKGMELQGYGESSCNGTGTFVLRYADEIVAPLVGQYNLNLTYHANAYGQSAGAADSGGPYWRFFNGVPYQVGVVKSGVCGGDTYASRPENFEQWALEVVYNAPIHIPIVDVDGRGMWAIVGSSNPEFWTRPLADNWTQFSPYFTPCPYTTNPYTVTADYNTQLNHDYLYVQDDSGFSQLTGTGQHIMSGAGQMRLGYSTDIGGASNGMNWLTVQCDYGSQAAALVCHGGRCLTTRDPLPNSFSSSASWNPCGGGAFYYFLDYDTELNYDFITVNGSRYTGRGSVQWQYVPGPTQVSVSTDVSVNSHGIRSLKAACYGF